MYLPSTHIHSYLCSMIYGVDLLLTEWVIEVKPDINLVEVHPIIESWWASSGWCACGYWFTLVQNAELVPLPPSLVQTLKRRGWNKVLRLTQLV